MTPQHRGHNEGTLSEVRPGVWRLRVSRGRDTHGRWVVASKTVYVGGRGKKRQALAELDKFRQEVRAKGRPGEEVPDPTVDQLLTDWLAHLERVGAKAPATLEVYGRRVDKHIRPALGPLRVDQLTGHRLDTFYAHLSRTLSPATIQGIHWCLSGALSLALDWNWINKKPRAHPPSIKKIERTALTPEQFDVLLKAAEAKDPVWGALLVVAAATGARRGELCGLKWADLDWNDGVLTIERQIARLKGGWQERPPKGGKKRWVTLAPHTLDYLSVYHDHKRERWRSDPVGYLLSFDRGDQPINPGNVSETLKRIGDEVGIPLHPHALRHMASTYLTEQGVDPVTAAARLGHSPEMTLGTYSHRVTEADRAAAELLARRILPKRLALGSGQKPR